MCSISCMVNLAITWMFVMSQTIQRDSSKVVQTIHGQGISHQGTWANTLVIQQWSKLFIHNLKHVHTNFMSEICCSIWFNGKKLSLRNGVGQTIAKMWILTVHPTSPQQLKVILSSFNSIRGLPAGCLCLHVKVYVFVKRNFLIFKTHSNVMYPWFIHSVLWFHIWSILVNT